MLKLTITPQPETRTTMEKGRDGWRMESYYHLGGNQVLTISTSKSGRGGLSTFASVMHHRSDYGCSCVLFQDYSKTVLREVGLKCTEKNVQLMHESVIVDATRIIEEASMHQDAIALKAAAQEAREDREADELAAATSSHIDPADLDGTPESLAQQAS